MLAGLFLLAYTFWPAAVEMPRVLRVGVLPDQSVADLSRRYAPLLDYLAHEIGIPCELVVPADYHELLERFHNQEIELAYFGGLTFLTANLKDGAVPVVMRDVDAKFRSYFLVRAGEQAKTVAAMKGGRLAFGSRLSTSGHLMPRHFLLEQGIEPEAAFSEVIYSGAHDATAYLVRDGKADLGAANAIITDRMFRDGRLDRGDVRVLWRTPSYPDYVWAMRKEIDADIRNAVQRALLALSPENAAHGKILSSVGAESFLPAGVNDFLPLRQIAESLDLLG